MVQKPEIIEGFRIKGKKKITFGILGFLLDENAEIIGNPDGEQMKNKDAKEQNGNEEKEKKRKMKEKKNGNFFGFFYCILLFIMLFLCESNQKIFV